MTEEQIKARLSDEARAWTEREERRKIADAAFERSRRHTRNIEALILAFGFGLFGGLCGLFLIWVTS